MNAPRLTIYNRQRANLSIVNQVSYVKDYDVEVAQTAFIADPLVDVVQDGLTLDVKPTVSYDRKYVTLELQPTVATLLRPIRTFETNLSGLTTPVIIELPEVITRSAATTVTVPDHGYVVIGGLKHVTTRRHAVGDPDPGPDPDHLAVLLAQGTDRRDPRPDHHHARQDHRSVGGREEPGALRRAQLSAGRVGS